MSAAGGPFVPPEQQGPTPVAPEATGRRAIFASGAWIAISTLLPFLATAALSVVAGRVLGAELLGQQSLIAFVGALVVALLVNSLTDSSIRWLSAYRASAAGRVASLERWTMYAHAVAGLATAGALAGVGLLRGELVTSWLILAATAFLDAIGWGLSSRIIARDGWAPVARRRLATQLLAVGLGIAAVLAGLGIAGIFAANAVASVVLLGLLRPVAGRLKRSRRQWVPRAVLALWAVFAVAALLKQAVSGRVEILFLGAFADGSEIAQYSIALMLVTSAMVLPTALAGAALPAVAAASGGGDDARASRAAARALRVAAVASVPLTALVAATGPALVLGLYGEQFERAGELTRYLAVVILVVPGGQLAVTYWSGVGRMRAPVVAGTAAALLELVLALSLVPPLGAGGAVLASISGQITAAAVVLVLTWRAIGRPSLNLPGWAATLAVGVCAYVAGVLATAPGGLVGTITGSLATASIFLLLAWLLGRVGLPLLSEEDGHWLEGALPERLSPLVRPLVAG
jgi:O-antigen/teichoic acid export membrane protein